MLDFFLLIVLFLVLWFSGSNLHAKEIARRHGRAACEAAQLQFLDDTVEHKRLWLRRNEHGRIELCRLFFFEYATATGERLPGRLVLAGRRLAEIELDAYRIS